MTPISAFFPYVLPYVPGCPEPMAQQAVVDAAIAFCEDSMVLQEVLPDFDTVIGQSQYTLVPPELNNQVARILDVVVGGTPVLLISQPDTTGFAQTSGTPKYAYTTRTGSVLKLNVYPTPDAVLPVSVKVALRPTKTAATLDDDLFGLWSEPITAGALARLFAVPNQPFSNPGSAGSASMAAVALARRARVEGSYGRTASSMRVRQRPFA